MSILFHHGSHQHFPDQFTCSPDWPPMAFATLTVVSPVYVLSLHKPAVFFLNIYIKICIRDIPTGLTITTSLTNSVFLWSTATTLNSGLWRKLFINLLPLFKKKITLSLIAGNLLRFTFCSLDTSRSQKAFLKAHFN